MVNLAIARLLVFGNVQGVGFRAYVKQIARNMQINGFARNLDDGSVEIYAQAAKQEINSFAGRLSIQGDPENPLSLHVARIEVIFEDDERFVKPYRELAAFEIDYGRPLGIENKESIEKAEIATLMMHSLISKTDSFRKETSQNFKNLENTLGSKTDSFRKESNQNFKRLEDTLGSKTDSFRKESNQNFKNLENTLGSKTDSFRKETGQNFNKLDIKYGSVSSALKSIGSGIKGMSGSIKQSNKLLVQIAKRFDAH